MDALMGTESESKAQDAVPPQTASEDDLHTQKKRRLDDDATLTIVSAAEAPIPAIGTTSIVLSSCFAFPAAYDSATTQERWLQSIRPPGISRKQLRANGLSIQRLRCLLSARADVISLKLDSNQIVSSLERAYVMLKPRGEFTHYRLDKTVGDGWMSGTVQNKLKKLSLRAPNFLARAVTSDSVGHTNGFATDGYFVPSGALDGRTCRPEMYDIPMAKLTPMIGTHLAWEDRIQDECLSWTRSCLSAIVHLYLRHLKGQGEAYLFCIDRRQASNLPNKDGAIMRAEFLHALDVCNETNVLMYAWEQPLRNALAYCKFTHEYGVGKYLKEATLQPVSYECLIQNGLSLLFPGLSVPKGMKACGLSEVTLYARRTNLGPALPPEPTTNTTLATAEDLAWLFVRQPKDCDRHSPRPPLALLVLWLSLQKRAVGDELFKQKIRELGCQRKDLDEVIYRGYENIPDNLPEEVSWLNLLHDVQAVVGGPPLKQAVMITGDSVSGKWFARAEKTRGIARLYYDPAEGLTKSKDGKTLPDYEVRSSCQYSCRCEVWGPVVRPRKRKQRTDNGDDGNDGNDGARDVIVTNADGGKDDVGKKDDQDTIALEGDGSKEGNGQEGDGKDGCQGMVAADTDGAKDRDHEDESSNINGDDDQG